MRKCILLCAALIISTFMFAQNAIQLNDIKATEEEGWVGNTDMTNLSLFEDAEYVIAPRMFNPEINGTIERIKFVQYTHATYPDYNTTSYTLKIYENVNLEYFDEGSHLYTYESCGDLVYTQDFTVDEENGWKEVVLDTPYIIKDGDFWVGIQMHGQGTIVTGGKNETIEGLYYYTEMRNYEWFWSPPYFFENNGGTYEEVLYSCCLAIYVVEDDAVQEASQANVTVYPNPVQGQLTISGDDLVELQLMDKMGRVLNTRSAAGQTATIDMSQMPAGVYFVRVVTENGVAVRRVVNMD